MNRLSSLTLTLYALGAVLLCLAVGMALAQLKPFSAAMPAMDHGLILDWLLSAFSGEPAAALLGGWFLALCASVGLLVLNLCACTLTRLLPRLRNGARVHSWLLLLAHALMVLILLGHLSQMALGFKQENIKLLTGQSRELSGGILLTVEAVDFVDDPALLNLTYLQARKAHVASAFHRQRNMARISLTRNGEPVLAGELRILDPLLSGGLRITLSDFYRDDSGVKPQVGAVITAIHNPMANLFFAAYLAWIAVYLMLAFQAFLPNGSSITKACQSLSATWRRLSANRAPGLARCSGLPVNKEHKI